MDGDGFYITNRSSDRLHFFRTAGGSLQIDCIIDTAGGVTASFVLNMDDLALLESMLKAVESPPLGIGGCVYLKSRQTKEIGITIGSIPGGDYFSVWFPNDKEFSGWYGRDQLERTEPPAQWTADTA